MVMMIPFCRFFGINNKFGIFFQSKMLIRHPVHHPLIFEHALKNNGTGEVASSSSSSSSGEGVIIDDGGEDDDHDVVSMEVSDHHCNKIMLQDKVRKKICI